MSQIKLKNVRLSFPSLFKKGTFEGQETKFEATFLMPHDSAMANLVETEMEKFIADKFNGKPPKGLKKTCWIDGDDKDYDGYAGMMALKSASARRPMVVDRDQTPLVEEDGRIYAGCYVNAIVDFWYSDHQRGGKQILCTLHGVQFAKDGDAFGAPGIQADAFDDLGDEDEDF